MRTYFLLIFVFLSLGLKRVEAEVLSGELENPGYDPLFWVSSTDCIVMETEANKRYHNSISGLLKIEQNIVMNNLCDSLKGCNLKLCKNNEFDLANKNSSLPSAESDDLVDNKIIIKLEIRAKAELGKLLKERRAEWKNKIEQAKKAEQLEKLSWQKLVMPFDEIEPGFIAINQSKPPPASSLAPANLPTKKDKYFNVLKKQ